MENNVRLWILYLGFSLPFLFLLTPFFPLRNFKLARKIIQDPRTAVILLVFLNLLEIYGRKFKVVFILRPSKNPTLFIMNSQTQFHGVYNYGVFLISVYITEYYTINKNTKIAVRGVLMYREKRDLSEKRKGKVMVICVCYRAFPKRSQRREMWKKLCWSELKYIHVEFVSYYFKNDLVGIGKSDRRVFGFEVRALRRRLGPDQKKLFDLFYYQK